MLRLLKRRFADNCHHKRTILRLLALNQLGRTTDHAAFVCDKAYRLTTLDLLITLDGLVIE